MNTPKGSFVHANQDFMNFIHCVCVYLYNVQIVSQFPSKLTLHYVNITFQTFAIILTKNRTQIILMLLFGLFILFFFLAKESHSQNSMLEVKHSILHEWKHVDKRYNRRRYYIV